MTPDPEETRRFDPEELAFGRHASGTVLSSRYRLGALLGRGGMGVVFRATDLELRREVAVKLLPATTASTEARERFLREARAAAALNHPNIVAVHDVGEDAGVPFFVMELVEGPHLGQSRTDDWGDLVAIATQICDALDHAHAHGIVHRDLKPDNVLLSGDAEGLAVKLADLGLAMPAWDARITSGGAIVGTAAYMAPEQALGQIVDGRADLYALGVVLYELATGRLPFRGDDPLAIVSQHVHAPVVPPRALRSDLPAGLESVILRLLAKDPSQRFATAGETGAALRGALTRPQTDLGDAPVATVALLDALSRGRLVGRDVEFAEARELWRRARAGTSHCLLLGGEPGAGKTRLAREIAVQAALDGATVLSGACYEYEATTPYLPFVEAFRRWLRDEKSVAAVRNALADAAPQVAKLTPEIETLLGAFPPRTALPPHEERLVFFDAIANVFRRLSRPHGLLFYIDDLHWADSSSLWLLGHLLRTLRDAPVLFAASYRETELDRTHPLSKALVDWNRERLTTRVVLRRFGAAETRAQLAALLGEDAGADFAAAVHRETEGNPFFAEEVLKALIEQGSVRREAGRWQLSAVGELVIPQSVKAAVSHRLDRASATCNEVLRAAALLGKTFDFVQLAAAAGDHGEDALLDALDEAVTAQLLVAGSRESFAFTHDKIREVLYEELNPIRRRRMHQRTAEGLEKLRGRDPVAVETLAHHFIAAGEHERGLFYAKQAGVEAERVFAYDEAIAAYSQALECAETLGLPDEQLGLEDAMGKACMIAGNSIPASEHFERALVFANEPVQRARLQTLAAHSLVTNGDPRGLEFARAALTVLDPEVHPLDTASALTVEARFHHLEGRHRHAVELLLRAAALTAPLAAGSAALDSFEATTLMMVFAYLAGAHQHLGLFADSDGWARRAIDFGKAHGVLVAQAAGYEFMGENACHCGDWPAGLEAVAREREIATRVHSRERQAWTHLPAGICSAALGDEARAEQEFTDGIALAAMIGERRLESILCANFAVCLADLGRHAEAMEMGTANLARAEILGLLFMRTEARRCLAHVQLASGATEEALRLCDEVRVLVAGTDSRVSLLWMGPLEVEALLAAGRHATACDALAAYRVLVEAAQSPRFTREIGRLTTLVDAAAS